MIVYAFGSFTLEREHLLLSHEGHPLPLGPKVVETLVALIEHPGEVVGKPELLARVWPEGYVDEANLAQNIYVIRKTLRSQGGIDPVETVPRRGYRFTEPVALLHREQPLPQAQAAPRPHPFRRPVFLAAAVLGFALLTVTGLRDVARSRPAPGQTALSPSIRRLYQMGEFYWNRRTAESIVLSRRYFGEVVKAAPGDARGYAGLADAYVIQGDYGFGKDSSAVSFALGRRYAEAALKLDPDSATALAALGLADERAGHTERALSEYRRAIALDPHNAAAHQWYGTLLLRRGDATQALSQLQIAAQLDPVSVAATDWLASAAYFARRYRDAIAYAQQALELSPQRYDVYIPMGMAYEARGSYGAAIAAYRKYGSSCSECRSQAAALLAHAYAALHRYGAAQAELRIAEAGIASRTVDPEDVVTALVALGRRTEALQMIKRDLHSQIDGIIAIDPRMDAVRDDSRFRPYTQGPA